MNDQTVQVTAKKPTRYVERFDGAELEYVKKKGTIAKLFNLEDQANDFPMLLEPVPVRLYFIAGTDIHFEHPLVPKIDLNHKFDLWELAILIPYIVKGEGLPPYIYGLHGTGKSSTIEQLHARLGLPKVNIILGEDSEVIDLGGQMLPVEAGGMKFFDGLLIQAMRAGWTLQIDEFDLLPTRQQKMLNEVLENRRFTIEITGEQVIAHPNWRIVVTANTNNTGSSGMFVSSGNGDSSVNDRFVFIQKDYLESSEEKSMLLGFAKKHLGILPQIKTEDDAKRYLVGIDALVEKMVEVANSIRDAHKETYTSTVSAGLPVTISTRTLKEWLRVLMELSRFAYGASPAIIRQMNRRAYETVFANSVPLENKDDVMQVFDDIIGC